MPVNNSVNNIFKNQPVTAVTSASYTALPTDVIIDVNFAGAVAITLPAPSVTGNKGKFYIIKDTSGLAGINAITVTPASGTIDGAASLTINSNYGNMQVFTDGVAWFSQSLNNSSVFAWNAVSGTSQTAVSNNGYYLQNAALTTVTLPSVATTVVGQEISVAGVGAGGWLIAQNATQFIDFGNQVTTTGVGGSLASTNQFDCVKLLAVSATQFVAIHSIGNLTLV